MRVRRLALNTLSAFLVLLGLIWIAQGVNILPGSFMTGDPMWAVIGAIVAVGALAMLVVVNSHRWR
jgi:hypothetical protein